MTTGLIMNRESFMYPLIKHDKTFSHTSKHPLHLCIETLTGTGNIIQLSFLFHFKETITKNQNLPTFTPSDRSACMCGK